MDVPYLPVHGAVLSDLVHVISGRLLVNDVANAPTSNPAARLYYADKTINRLDADHVFNLSDVDPYFQHRRRDKYPLAVTLDESFKDG